MKLNLTNLTLIVTALFFLSITTFGQGGIVFKNNNTNFVEDSIFNFKISADNLVFDALLSEFDKKKLEDPTVYNGYEVAGFCFIPLMEINSLTIDTIHFYTKGFKLALVLWAPKFDQSGQVIVDELKLMGYPSLGDAFNPSNTSIPSEVGILDPNVNTNGVVIERENFSILYAQNVITSREFEFVYLDLRDYEYLAFDPGFYATPRTDFGIVFERAVSSIDTISEPNIVNYRNLIFRPKPIPPISSQYPSESAITYSYGAHCPPYWIRKPLEAEAALFRAVEESNNSNHSEGFAEGFEEGVKEGRGGDLTFEKIFSYVKDKLWFWVLLILAILGIILGIPFARNGFRFKEQDSTDTDELSSEDNEKKE
jgi:hypothetical protein